MASHPVPAVADLIDSAKEGMSPRLAVGLAYLEGGRDVLRALHDCRCEVTMKDSRCRLPADHAGAHEVGALGILDVELRKQGMVFGWWPESDYSPRYAAEAEE